MSAQPRISVIVPVYCAERYLPRCVESLQNQTYPDYEIWLVDDGSPDGCPALCDAYAKKDARVHVLHTENGGVSAARNLGAQAARGAYIVFVDADDYVDSKMLTHLVETQKTYGAELSICGVAFVDEAGKRLPPYPAPTRCAMKPAQALEAMLYQTVFYTSPWGKLIPTALVRAYPFPLGVRYEDMATTYLWLANAARIAVDTEPLYAYVQHKESFMGRAFHAERLVQLDTSDAVYDYIAAHFSEILPAARARRFSAYAQVLLQMPQDRTQYADAHERILRVLRASAGAVARDSKCRKKDRIAAAAFRLGGERLLRWLWRVRRA